MYNIDVHIKSRSWTVSRRYREFHRLHEQVRWVFTSCLFFMACLLFAVRLLFVACLFWGNQDYKFPSNKWASLIVRCLVLLPFCVQKVCFWVNLTIENATLFLACAITWSSLGDSSTQKDRGKFKLEPLGKEKDSFAEIFEDCCYNLPRPSKTSGCFPRDWPIRKYFFLW